MRGNLFHNMIVQKARTVFVRLNWQVHTEYGVQINRTKYYFDLLAIKGRYKIACEIETTSRHAIDNALKARLVDYPFWFIVPTLKVKWEIVNKLKKLIINPASEPIKVLLLDQLEQEIINCL